MHRRRYKKGQRFFGVTFNNLGYNLTLPEAKTETGDACSKQNMGYSPKDINSSREPNLWETYEIPYINILMDHPFHYENHCRMRRTHPLCCVQTGIMSTTSEDTLKISGILISCHMRGWNLAAGISRSRSVESMFYMRGHFRSTQLRR